MATAAELRAQQEKLKEARQTYAKTKIEYSKRLNEAMKKRMAEGASRAEVAHMMNNDIHAFENYGFSAQDMIAYRAAKREAAALDKSISALDWQILDQANAERRASEKQQSNAEKYETKKKNSDMSLAQKTESPLKPGQPDERHSYNPNTGHTVMEKKHVYSDSSGIFAIREEVAKDGTVVSSRIENKRTPEQKKQAQKEYQRKKDETTKADTELKKQQEEEERKKKEADKAARKVQKEKEKAEDKTRREQEHEKRVEQRAQNKKEYDDALAKYKEERAKAKEKQTEERAQEAMKRHDEFAKQHNELVKQGTDQGATAYKKINDYTYTEYEKWKEQEANGGYKGTSAQAKKELRDSISDIWNASTKDARDELSGAYKNVSGSVDALKNARQTMQDLYKGKVLGDGINGLSNSALNIQVAAMAVHDKNGMVDLQKAILTQKLADRMLLDNIADAVSNQMYSFQTAGANIKYAYLAQKAYVSAYIKQTFANPQFMANITKVVATKVDNYVEALTNEQVAKIGTKIDNVFTKVDKKLDRITYKATTTLDKLSKINILESMNDKIDKLTSLSGLQKKLDKSPVGFLLSPLVSGVASVGGLAVKGLFASTGITSAVARVQAKIFNLQKGIVKAKAWVTQKVQMVKNYVNTLKEKAKAVVTSFANKIVADIKSKIKNVATGMFGGKGISI